MIQDPPVVIALSDVSKQFVIRKDKAVKDRVLHPILSRQHEEAFWALRGVNLQIHAGSTIGLIGPNGSGKSTLLKVIGGIIDSDSGAVLTRGRMAALLELGAGFHPDLTGRENVFLNAAILGLTKEETEERFDEIVAFSGIEQFIDTPVKFYSSGMYVRLAFAVAVNVDPDVILVDEVLAVGDEAFQQKCLAKIEDFQAEGRTIVIVSHSMGQIASMCDRVLVLGRGEVVFDGDPQEAVSVLRAGFIRAADEDGSVGVDAIPAEQIDNKVPVELLSVESQVPNREALLPGETLVVTVEFRVEDPTDRWDLTVSLVNPLDSTVLTASSHSTGIGNSPISGTQQLTMSFPGLSLSAGGYTVTVVYFDEKQREVTRLEGVAKFKVDAGQQSIGTVYSEASGALSPVSS